MNRERSTAPQPHRCVRLQISEGPTTWFQVHLRAAAPLHCCAFCSHCSPLGPEKLCLQSKHGFERLTGRGAKGLGAVVVAWDPTWPSASNNLVNPGDPALRPARALCLRVRPVEGCPPAAVVGPHSQLVASFPKEDLVTKRSWKCLCTQAETWRPCKGPRVRIKEKQNRNPSISN